MTTDALYHAQIVEHDRSPRNAGPLDGATHAVTIDNPLCGDVVTVRAIVDGERLVDVRFEARGCALCRAAASMMTVAVHGSSVADARALAARFEAFVGGGDDHALGELVAFRGVRQIRSRRTCATLPFRALVRSLEG